MNSSPLTSSLCSILPDAFLIGLRTLAEAEIVINNESNLALRSAHFDYIHSYLHVHMMYTEFTSVHPTGRR